MTVRVGTRGSALAVAQAGDIAERLRAVMDDAVELVTISSEGDTNRASLSEIGGTGVFAAALREALLAGRCDVVVHSLKDLPTLPHPGLTVAAVPEREDARDALCSQGTNLAELRTGARVGTGSPRRAAQLRRARPDLDVVDIRGNVDTRLGRVSSGDLDAVVLSLAGLRRLGREDEVSEVFELDEWPTAPGQGALAIEVRNEDAAHLRPPFPEASPLGAAVSSLTDTRAEQSAHAERSVLRGLEAGCTAPIGVSAVVASDHIVVTGVVYAPDGGSSIEQMKTVDFDPSDLSTLHGAADRAGREVVTALLDRGAADLVPVGAIS